MNNKNLVDLNFKLLKIIQQKDEEYQQLLTIAANLEIERDSLVWVLKRQAQLAATFMGESPF